MRVMVIVKSTKESEAENNPLDMEGAAEMFEAMGKYNEELVKAGIMLAGGGVLDLAGAVDGRGDRVGEALPQPDAGSIGPRDPPALGAGGLRSSDRRTGERAPRQDGSGIEVSGGS